MTEAAAAHTGLFHMCMTVYNKRVKRSLIEMSATWTIGQLTDKIMEKLLLNPLKKEITIILAGEKLEYNQQCKDFSNYGTFHVVVKDKIKNSG